MAWRVDPKTFDRVFERWAEGKSQAARWELLLVLADLVDHPLTELPGIRMPALSPMWRWAKIGRTLVVFLVVEPQGILVITDIRED